MPGVRPGQSRAEGASAREGLAGCPADPRGLGQVVFSDGTAEWGCRAALGPDPCAPSVPCPVLKAGPPGREAGAGCTAPHGTSLLRRLGRSAAGPGLGPGGLCPGGRRRGQQRPPGGRHAQDTGPGGPQWALLGGKFLGRPWDAGSDLWALPSLPGADPSGQEAGGDGVPLPGHRPFGAGAGKASGGGPGGAASGSQASCRTAAGAGVGQPLVPTSGPACVSLPPRLGV